MSDKLFFASAFLCIFSISVYSQTLQEKPLFELKCSVSGALPGNKIYLSYTSSKSNKIIDSTDIVNNRCKFTGEINYPTNATIYTNSGSGLTKFNSATIYLEPDEMLLAVDVTDFRTLKLTNSKTQLDYNILTQLKKVTITQRDSISLLYRAFYDKLKTSTDTFVKNDINTKIEGLHKLTEKNINSQVNIELDFIDKNPSSFVTIYLLEYRLKRSEITYEVCKAKFDRLSQNVTSSATGINFGNVLKRYKAVLIGSVAPDFTEIDFSRNTIMLSLFRTEKVILLDFWASWCVPCREDFPFLKKEYSKYKENGLEIISISIDEKPEAWRNAILKEDVGEWIHFSTTENKSKIEDIYAVTGIPVKILINKEGVIVGKWEGGGSQNQIEIENKLAEILSK